MFADVLFKGHFVGMLSLKSKHDYIIFTMKKLYNKNEKEMKALRDS